MTSLGVNDKLQVNDKLDRDKNNGLKATGSELNGNLTHNLNQSPNNHSNDNPNNNPNNNANNNLIPNPSFLVQLSVGLIGMFAFLQVYSVQAILPVLRQEFLASETQVGMTVGITVMAIAFISPFIGMLSDAVGRKNVIIGSLLFLSIPTVLLGFSQSIPSMIGWRFLQGLAIPGITVVTIAYMGEEYIGKNVVRLTSLYISGTVLGGFLGRFVTGHLQEIIGWRSAFFWMGGVTLLGAVWTWFTLPNSKKFIPNTNLRSSLDMLYQHLHNRYVITACLLGVCVLFSLVGCFTYINLYLSEPPYNLSSAVLANIFLVYLIGMVITPIASTLISRFGAARMVMAALPISMLGVLLCLAHPFGWIVVGLAVMSTGVFITQSATITYISANVTEGRSLASGLYYMCYYLGGSIGAWVCGLAYAHSGWRTTVAVLVGVQILAFLMAAFGLIKKPLPNK